MRARIIIAILMMAAALTAAAQVDNTRDRGFNAETAYQVGEFDAVNTLNGNLTVTVPLGPEYKSNGTLSYSFTLSYNSQFWDHVRHSDDDFSPYRFLVPAIGPVAVHTAAEMARLSPFSPLTPDNQNRDQVESNLSGMEAYPSLLMNAGLGWMVTLGELENGVVYVSPDGGRHEFFLNHHSVVKTGVNVPNLTAARIGEILGAATIFYTRDSSYLRMLVYPVQNGVFRREVQFPDGMKKTFSCQGTAQYCGNFEESRWYLDSIRDPYGNALTVNRPVQPLAGDWPWTYVETSNGVEVRRHTLTFYLLQRAGGRTEMRLRAAQLAATGGSALYTLQYDAGSVFRERGSGWHALHTEDHERAALNAQGKIDVSFLRKIELPSNAGDWTFDYDHDLVDDTVSQGPEGTYWGISEHDGYLSSVTVPAGATTSYEYESRVIPAGGCAPPTVGDGPRPVRSVSRRRVNVNGRVSEWRYSHYFLPRVLNPGPCPMPRELLTAVVDPYWTVTLNYFSVYRTDTPQLDDAPGPDGYLSKEYGLPITRLTPADARGRLLSSEIYQCAAADFGNGGALAGNPSKLLQRYGGPSCRLEQQRYVQYEYGSVDCSLGSLGNDCVAANTRVKSEATYYPGSPQTYTFTDYDDFDGLGHYRSQKNGGNLYLLTFGDVTGPAGVENDDVKTIARQYNQGVNYFLGSDTVDSTTNQHVESSGAPWVLGTYPRETVSQWILDPAGSRVRQTFKKEFWFDGDTGQVKRTRTLAKTGPGDPARSPADVVVDYVRVPSGARATITENYFGGDGGALTDADLSSLTLSTPDYAIRKRLFAGGVEETTYLDCNADFMKVHTDVVDANTGRSLSTKDTANAMTSFEYDALGRTTKVTPPSEAPLIYSYLPKSGGAGPKVKMSRDSGTDHHDAAEWHYDGLGRLTSEFHWVAAQDDYSSVASGFLNQQDSTYDLIGRKVTESAVRKMGDAAPGLTRFVYDVFGRVISQRYEIPNPNPDLGTAEVVTETTFERHGPWRVVEKTEPLGAKTSYYDSLGRVIGVRERSTPGGQGTYVSYQYNAQDQLIGVFDAGTDSSTADVPALTRTLRPIAVADRKNKFEYDGRGFLSAEYHPELDADIKYEDYDARGHAGRRWGGAPPMRFFFDPAERLRQVRSGGKTLKRFRYSGTGKLTEAIRFNIVKEPLGTASPCRYSVTETYEYLGLGTRLSKTSLTTTEPAANTSGADYDRIVLPAEARCTSIAAFSAFASYSYNPFGSMQTLTYPSPGPVLQLKRWGNALKQVPGYVDNVVYHPKGLVTRVRHSNNTRDVITFDANGLPRVDTIQLIRDIAQRQTMWQHGAIEYDAAGNISSIANLAGRDRYDYDTVGRLVSATLSNAPQNVNVTRTQSFNRWGNIVNLNGTAVSVTAKNRLDAAGYDAFGNVTALPASPVNAVKNYFFEYDAFNSMTRMYSLSSTLGRVFLYNAGDERVAMLDFKKVPQRTKEVWSLRGPDNLVLSDTERTGQGNGTPVVDRTRQYVYADGRFVADIVRASGATADTVRHFHLDHLGSVRAMTDCETLNPCQPRLVAGRIRTYLPFGEEVGSLADPARLGFTGHERDEDGTTEPNGDFDYMHARYYSPAWGRFLSVDPIPAVARSVSHPQRWNKYSYAANNPLRNVDPDGRKDKPATEADRRRFRERPNTATPIDWANLKNPMNRDAYNCHSFAWHEGKGDPSDSRNAPIVKYVPRWDDSPVDDIKEQRYEKLAATTANKPGDRVIYGIDENHNGKLEPDEVTHSAIVAEVDKEGNTTVVVSKWGAASIFEHHPALVPSIYGKLREYYRRSQE